MILLPALLTVGVVGKIPANFESSASAATRAGNCFSAFCAYGLDFPPETAPGLTEASFDGVGLGGWWG